MQNLPPLLSDLELGTFLRYSPYGKSPISIRSRLWRNAIKNARPDWIATALDALKESLERTGLSPFFGSDVSLVPVPRSAPLSVPDALWPGRAIGEALVRSGLAKEVLTCLERSVAVPRSATAESGGRPSLERHLESMRAEARLLTPSRITVLDDVVTIGRTLLAAASLVHATFPQAEVKGFALLHAYGLVTDIDSIEAPYVGRLRRRGGWIEHDPPQ